MHSFVSYLYYLLSAGLQLAIPAALVCAVILAVCYAVFRRQGRRFPWGKAICAMLYVGWAVVTVFVTLLRGEPGVRMWNLQLFLAWREAYQRFTLQLWLNVLLNIALFVPPGVLLPLLWKPFRRWYAMLGAGFGCSLFIELMQLFTARGMCDVDDLFTNTLGAMLGWCVSMLFLSLREKSRAWKRYLALPAAFALALTAIFASYALKPYGNLRDAAVTASDLRAVNWSLAFSPEDGAATAPVYRTQALDNAGADRFAADFAATHGVEFPDVEYYDDTALYMNHSTGDFLNVTLHDGTWEYWIGDNTAPVFDVPAQDISETLVREALGGLGFSVPEGAFFALAPSGGEGFYDAVFTAEMLPTENGFLHGTLTCDLKTRDDGGAELNRLENGIVPLTPVREEAILSPAQAVDALRAGRSFDGRQLAEFGGETIEILSCTLDYLSDSKGFYQPVYRLALALPGENRSGAAVTFTDYVPALA